jgi:hypothetical protein
VHAEVAQSIGPREVTRCLRDENLAAVTGGGDPRSAMHIDPDVSLVGHGRLARMQSDADSDRSGGEHFACRCRGGEGVGRLRKRYEERIAFGADFDAT